MDCNGTDVYSGVLTALTVLMDSAASRARPGSGTATFLLAAAAKVRAAIGPLHMPLIGRLARLGAALARPLIAG